MKKNSKMHAYYNNPNKGVYHEAGHLLATYRLTGELIDVHKTELPKARFKSIDGYSSKKPSFGSLEGYNQIFKEVCVAVAGGVAEKALCGYAFTPKELMNEDIDRLYDYARDEWSLSIVQKKNGDQVCSWLDNMIKTACDFMTIQLSQNDGRVKMKEVSEYLLYNDLAIPDAANTLLSSDSPEAVKIKKDLLRIMKYFRWKDHEQKWDYLKGYINMSVAQAKKEFGTKRVEDWIERGLIKQDIIKSVLTS